MGNIRFELLIPSSWLHKLKGHKSRGRRRSSQLPQNSINKDKLTATATAAAAAAATRTTPSTRSKQRAEHLPCSPVNTKASDTHFPADLRPKQRPQRRLLARRRAAGNPCVAIASSVSCNFARTLTSKKPAGQGSHRPAVASDGDLDFLPEEKEHEPEPANSPEITSTAASAAPESGDDDLVIIKYASARPEEEFTESMVEMIVEHGICDARGLEDLLACYLSLNSEEHHEVIIEVFERIWYALADAELL